MMYVIKRQPWLVCRQNLLVELYDPRKPLNDYRFEYLYANVRLYGIPREARTVQTISEILNQIGQPSDLDEQMEYNITRDEFYALARAKLNVNKPAKDKVFRPISPTRRTIVFVHCDKIQRICTFCAGFFHNSDDCILKSHQSADCIPN